MKSVDDDRFGRFLEVALCALQREDLAMRTAFEPSLKSRQLRTPDRPVNRGLAYWVFETTLAYFIFRGCLEAGWDADWEYPYPNDNKKKADLVLWGNGEAKAPPIVLELKWWNNEHGKTLDGIREDIEKLQSWDDEGVDRYLLAFWWHWYAESSLEKDQAVVEEALKQKTWPAGCELHWVGSFPTHALRHQGSDLNAYFAMAAIRVPASGRNHRSAEALAASAM